MDSVTLRKTHFKLGDFKNSYHTTTSDQNKEIEVCRARPVATLDESVKNDLRKSHFILGNHESNYNTIFRTEFFNKSDLKDNSMTNAKTIEKALRNHNYVLGNDKPDYKSETQAKYITPGGSYFSQEKKISTGELQKSHYIFGNNHDPWTTTTQSSYYAKDIQAKKHTKDLTRTNFILGEDNPDFKSVHQNTFVPHQYSKRNESKELADDLRKHHFVFGNESGTESLTSMNKQDFRDPKFSQSNQQAPKLDSLTLRASHFQLGDNSMPPSSQYETTYGSTMKYRDNPINRERGFNTFKSSVTINGEGSNNYQTESRINYNYKLNPISADEIKTMKGVIKNIRGHHFDLGECRNDFSTTTGATFLYDKRSADGAKGTLDASVKNDLRATHYKLGYLPDAHQTTHQATFVPVPAEVKKVHDPELRKSHFNINPGNRNVFDSKSIYMADFNKKQLVD